MRFVESGLSSGPTVIFIHGWPDGPQLWEPQMTVLEKQYRCIRMILPGYAYEEKFPFFGVPLATIAADFRDTIKEKIMAGRPASEKPMLVAHDWGCTISYELIYQNPDLISRVCIMDIGQHIKPSIPVALAMVTYQWILAGIFLMPGIIGNPATKAMAWLLGAPSAGLARQRMNHLYFQFWKGVFTGKALPSTKKFNPPGCPTLFIFGAKKPFMFHSNRFIEHVQKQPGSAVIPVASTHWFMVDPKTRDSVTTELAKFLGAASKL